MDAGEIVYATVEEIIGKTGKNLSSSSLPFLSQSHDTRDCCVI